MAWRRRPTRRSGRDRDRDGEPDRERVVTLAWLPLWQAQLVLHHLWESGVPTTMSEDFTAQLRFGAREPMAHLYVMAHRLDAARAAMAEVTGPD